MSILQEEKGLNTSATEMIRLERDKQLYRPDWKVGDWAYSFNDYNFWVVGEEVMRKIAMKFCKGLDMQYITVTRSRILRPPKPFEKGQFRLPFIVDGNNKERVMVDAKGQRLRKAIQ